MNDIKAYKLFFHKERNIEVVFAHIPNKRISSGTRVKAEAIKFAEDFLRADGIYERKVPTLCEFAKNYFKRRDTDSIYSRMTAFGHANREHWYVQMERVLENYILPRFGAYPLGNITPIAIENWIVSYKGRGKECLSGASRNKTLICFRYILDDAVRCGYLSTNPARLIQSPKEETQNRRALTIAEQEKLFPPNPFEREEIWGGMKWACYFSIMYDTGFRPAEVAGLRVKDIYKTPQGFAVFTSHTINGELKKPVERVKTSGKGMENRVGLLSSVSEALIRLTIAEENIKDEDEYLFLIDRADKTSWVFCATANKHMRGVLKRQGIEQEGLTQYNIRHTFVSYRRGNVNENVLALSMGHKNGVRDDYDHRTASILIRQLEAERAELFKPFTDEGIEPFCLNGKHRA